MLICKTSRDVVKNEWDNGNEEQTDTCRRINILNIFFLMDNSFSLTKDKKTTKSKYTEIGHVINRSTNY